MNNLKDNIIFNFTSDQREWMSKKKIGNLAKLILYTLPKKIICLNICNRSRLPIQGYLNILTVDRHNILNINLIMKKQNAYYYCITLRNLAQIEIILNYTLSKSILLSYDKFNIVFSQFTIIKKLIKIYYPKIDFKNVTHLKNLPYYHNLKSTTNLILKIISQIEDFLKKYDPEMLEIFKLVHHSTDDDNLKSAISSIKIQIFFRKINLSLQSIIPSQQDVFESMCLPFTPTAQQSEAAKTVLSGLNTKNIVLYGDVGSGKTLIAAGIINTFLQQKKNVFYLVPTRILVTQVINFLRECKINAQHYSDSDETSGIEVGTTEVFKNYDKFDLFIVDEEHKFGLLNKEHIIKNKQVLLMSATPIPGTIEKVKNNIYHFVTLNTPSKNFDNILEEFNFNNLIQYLSSEDKFLIITPFLNTGLFSCKLLYEQLKKIFPSEIYFLHGKLNKEEQHIILQAFLRDGRILISTSLSENGINIPNLKTIIIIYPERFGFAQLYQMRGRIDRENKGGGKCIMMHHNTMSESTRQRLNSFIKIKDGLWLSYLDYVNSGGGILGETQRGFSVGQLNDEELLEVIELINNSSDEHLQHIRSLQYIYDQYI